MEVQLHEKELRWNDRCSVHDSLPAYDATKDKYCDIFYRKESAAVSAPAVQSKRVTKDDIRQAYHAAAQDSSEAPLFASVAAAFDFEHHVGSDPGLELLVLRAILVREGLLTDIETLAHELTKPRVFAGDEPDYEGMNARMLDLLAQCRDRTLDVVEVTERWRGSVASGPTAPFVWQNTNYLLKMCRDLDYLSGVTPLLQMLNVQPESIRHNPLMLENTLDQPAFEPEAPADSAEGLSAEEKAEYSRKLHEKARMRRAEAVLSREEKLFVNGRDSLHGEAPGGEPGLAHSASAPATAPLVPGALDISEGAGGSPGEGMELLTGGPESSLRPPVMRSLMAGSGTEWGARQKELLTWYDEAQAQLARLKEPYLVRGGSKSTGRLSVPKREKLQPMQHMPSFARTLDRVPTPPQKKLTELLSTSPARATRPASGKRRLRAITAPYNSSLVPKPEGMDEPTSAGGARPAKGKSSKPEVRSRYMEPRKVWSEDDLDKQRQGMKTPGAVPESFDVAEGTELPRPMTPSVRNVVTFEDFKALQELEAPSEDITIVAASVLILLSEGATLPPDVRWSAFQAQDGDTFIGRIETFEPEDVPDFKLRALRRFLSIDAYNPVVLDQTSSVAAKLAVWILRVIAAHPSGGAYIKEVRSALSEWETLQAKPRKKKKKKVKKKKGAALAEGSNASPSGGTRQSEDLAHKLLGDMKRAAFGIEKNMIQELRSAVRGKMPPSCIRSLEAVALVLEPRKKPSIEIIRNLMVKGTAFEARLKGYDRKQAEVLTEGAVTRLQVYTNDPALEAEALGKTSKAVATLMKWVRAICAYAEHNNELRRMLAAEQAEMDSAATMLQGMQRAKAAKRAVSEKREQHQAASLLQRRTRVSQAKKVVSAKREAKNEAEQNKQSDVVEDVPEAAAAVESEPKKIFAMPSPGGASMEEVIDEEVAGVPAADGKVQEVSPQEDTEEKVETIPDEPSPNAAATTPVRSEPEVVKAPVDEDGGGGGDNDDDDDDYDDYASEGFGSPPPTPGDAMTPGKSDRNNLNDTYQSEDFEDFEDDEDGEDG